MPWRTGLAGPTAGPPRRGPGTTSRCRCSARCRTYASTVHCPASGRVRVVAHPADRPCVSAPLRSWLCSCLPNELRSQRDRRLCALPRWAASERGPDGVGASRRAVLEGQRVRLARIVRARRGRADRRAEAASACTIWRSRTPRTFTCDRRSNATRRAACCSRCSAPPATSRTARRWTWERCRCSSHAGSSSPCARASASDLHGARMRLEERPELLKEGTFAVLWAILDTIVDEYAPVIEGLE